MKYLLLISWVFLISSISKADILMIDKIADEPSNSSQGLLRPTRGMSMEQVAKQFGTANQEYPAVGVPPITRWQYSQYSVYFEGTHVINSVVNKAP